MTRRLEPAEEAAARLRAEALTPSERAALWVRIESGREASRPSRMRRVAIGGFAFASLAAAAVIVFFVATRKESPTAPVIQAACRLNPNARYLELPANCEAQSVRIGRAEWRLLPGARVAQSASGPQMMTGRVEFRVSPRSAPDFQVHVSPGHKIRVIGTVFQIVQQGVTGSVTVSEGVIEFVWNDGTHERVEAGKTLHWGPRRPAAPSRTPVAGNDAESTSKDGSKAHDKPSEGDRDRKAQTGASQNLESVMDRVLQLKSQRRFGELVGLLEQTLASGSVGPGQRERLSYELGLALEGAGRNPCAHWKRHVQAYGVGKHGGALEKRLERCNP